jgi:3-hydroxyacyl-[acyl-carrier-protein] dehydratase
MTPIHQKGLFYFDPNDPIYQDHFPGCPVVPGSLIVEAFLKIVAQQKIEPTAIKRFRFKRFVIPGTYAYQMVIATGMIDCTLLQKEETFATGKILYGG